MAQEPPRPTRKEEVTVPKYRVMLVSSASISIEVEADSPETAADLAVDAAYASLCHECSREVTLSGDWDAIDPDTGKPYGVEAG